MKKTAQNSPTANKTIGYLRVSTASQELEKNKADILKLANEKNLGQVIFVEEKDDIVNPLGAKGLGEIGIVGVAAAVANAIYHATGKRVRDLPITIDKLL